MFFFDTKIDYLKGVGPQKAELLHTELKIFTYRDMIGYYPFRYEDRSKFHKSNELREDLSYAQLIGRIEINATIGEGSKKRLVATFTDQTGSIELVWFQGIKWVTGKLKSHMTYVVFGKPAFYNGRISIVHPDFEPLTEVKVSKSLQPVYPSTEKLRVKGLDSKGIAKIQRLLLTQISDKIPETLPDRILHKYQLEGKSAALQQIHFPENYDRLEKARERLKFEELFFVQLRLMGLRNKRKKLKGQIFKNVPTLNVFYSKHLPFELTNAQKRVIREIYKDFCSGTQMNRLVQGDVGSGKTIVAFISMLIALDNGAQTCLMAPTEILAQQHYNGLKEFADKLAIPIALLTGSTRARERGQIYAKLESGELKMVIGTHALLEDTVQFNNLGLAVIDEQHRFGVEQRARLWKKNPNVHPHVLVMTATPIPRTLAMTLYGDLDLSVIDELPAGRKPIITVHRFDSHRLRVFGFMKQQLAEGRQIYVVYPLIEESEKLALKDLHDGYESISRAFPDVPLSIVHGKMNAETKDYEMARFLKAETKIMVATTVIEVGVNVPNASVMVIENAERFGLSQLHQLRGRVGRGADQSYCILMTGDKLSKDSRVRINTMVSTTNGFEIADVDLRLRGPGDITGTRQSGLLLDLKLTDLSQDMELMQKAREEVEELLEKDPQLLLPEHLPVRNEMIQIGKSRPNWSRIS